MTAVDLRAYGVTDAIMRQAREASGIHDPVVGRILSQAHELYRVVGEQGELFAEASGKLRHTACSAADFPAAGDFVLLDRATDTAGRAVIAQVLPRTSAFVRKAAGAALEQQVVAANIDVAFLCMSLVGDFNLRRLERYLTLAWESGAVPVVVLTKADACDSLERRLAAVQSVAFGVDVLAVSSMGECGCEAVRPYLRPGRTPPFWDRPAWESRRWSTACWARKFSRRATYAPTGAAVMPPRAASSCCCRAAAS